MKFGCGEAARNENDTKKLLDGSFKMPKVMKSMFNNLVNHAPSLVNSISIPVFLVIKTTVTVNILDSPAGYVCRVDSFPTRPYPTNEENVRTRFVPIAQLVLKTRKLMENNLALIRSSEEDNVDDDILLSLKSPQFYPASTSKRRPTKINTLLIF